MFRREPQESVSPVVRAMLAVAADGERYRVGHYGAITKVPRGNVVKKWRFRRSHRESHRGRSGRRSFSLPPFSRSPFCRNRLEPFMGNRLPQRIGAEWPLTCYVGAKREVNAQRYASSGQVNHHRHIEFRIIPLHVPSSVVLPKFLDHRFHSLRSGDWLCPELLLHTSRINPNRRDRDGDRPPRTSCR